MLPKALFLSTIEKIRQQEARIDEFDKALSKMCDGFPAFDKDNLYLLALRDLLKYTMQDQYDNIGWGLYEAPDAGYTVSQNWHVIWQEPWSRRMPSSSSAPRDSSARSTRWRLQ